MMRGVQLELPFEDIAQTEPSRLPGKVWQEGGRWHAEIGSGWWLFIAGTRDAAVKGVTRIYEQETGKVQV